MLDVRVYSPLAANDFHACIHSFRMCDRLKPQCSLVIYLLCPPLYLSHADCALSRYPLVHWVGLEVVFHVVPKLQAESLALA